MSAPRTPYVVCQSCKAERPGEQMQQAIDVFWAPIPDTYECRDQESCFQEVVKAAHAAGDVLRAARAPRGAL